MERLPGRRRSTSSTSIRRSTPAARSARGGWPWSPTPTATGPASAAAGIARGCSSELAYDDAYGDYLGFLAPRLERARELLAPHGTLYFHIDQREAHACKLLLDEIFGREAFLNELIWAYDYGAKPRRRWPAKHDTILVYVRTPGAHHFDADAVEREPYMAPGLVSAEKAARGKLPTDVWWHTIVPTNGRERTGYPTQKPEGILRRIVVRLLATRRLVPGSVLRLGHARRGVPRARPPVRADRPQPGGGRGQRPAPVWQHRRRWTLELVRAPRACGARHPPRLTAALRLARAIPWSICLITAVAAALRFTQLSARSPPTRSTTPPCTRMGELAAQPVVRRVRPGRAPGDRQAAARPVAAGGERQAVRLRSRVSLQLPEALAGTAAVPLLYDAVRPLAGRAAALASAAALALLPASVLTARSDTMDGVMMLLLVAALWLTVRALRPGRERALLLAGVAVGLAFEVKLMEALLALSCRSRCCSGSARTLPAAPPGAACSPRAARSRRRRRPRPGRCSSSLAPGHHPWSVGSTDGSVWNAMFVFNGFGKVELRAAGQDRGPGAVAAARGQRLALRHPVRLRAVGALALGAAALAVAGRLARPARRGAGALRGGA